jgi:parallel beta-helix repeat protein
MYASTFVAFVIAVATICTGFMDMVGEEVHQAEPFSEMIGGGSFLNAIQISPEGCNDEDPLGNLPVYHYCYLQRQLIGRHGYRSQRGIGSLRPAPCVDIQDIHEPQGQKISGSAAGNNHTAIFINGNDDFTAENGVTGGNGTPNNPYLIEGWTIIGNGSVSTGILIKNTTSWFIIRDCVVSNFTKGIGCGVELVNVSNGHLERVETLENHHGIVILESSDVLVSNCTSHHNKGDFAYGICVEESTDVIITGCHCYKNYDSILLYSSSHCIVEDSVCHDNVEWGIGIYSELDSKSQFNIIRNCTTFNNIITGIAIVHLKKIYDIRKRPGYNTISNCTVFNNGHIPGYANAFSGIELFCVDNTIVEDCAVYGNGDGIEIIQGSHTVVRNCTIYGQWMPVFNSHGIMVLGMALLADFCVNVTIEHCDLFDQDNGISLAETLRTKIHHNNIYNCSSGLDMAAAALNTLHVYQNNIYDNALAAYYMPRTYSDARNNWWGSPLGPSRGYFSMRGGVIHKVGLSPCLRFPWLTAPVPDAGRQT